MVYRNQMKNAWLWSCSFCLALALFSCSSGTDATPDCDPHAGSCMKQAGDYTITFDMSPKPVLHMKELTFKVSFSSDSPSISSDTLLLDLSMPGMDMGKNEVVLRKVGDNQYNGKGIIVKCPSGRTLWRATLLLSENMKPAFTFNVRD
ncbi:hypothetical protein [Prosthecochloris sp. SCSIO W1103]|uniref:hypothetical protein n=1 Tax=Prosthecochloris sp. SCSIO W1103 TaxID=2992244 RepID=UPI00223D3097|nr:hypothetical protein [Prosthecochloris sp. SCSIO W1103]UZJ38496.1 hypothetical protein OO005_04685 [Prosthecochloris sp. SCSIO W1103]